jgi:hypothetical protein
MARVRVHPIQLKYSVAKDGKQTRKLCGAQERWTSKQEPTVSGDALRRTLCRMSRRLGTGRFPSAVSG